MANVTKIFSILFGFIIVCYQVYIRFILVHIPRNLIINAPLETLSLYFIILLIFSSLFIYSLNCIFTKKNSNSFFIQYIKPIFDLVTNSLIYFDNFIKFHIILSAGTIAIFIGTYLAKILFNKHRIRFLLIICYYTPRIVILSIFLIDIIIYNRFYYFYLIFSYILYSLIDLSSQNLLRLSSTLEVYDTTGNQLSLVDFINRRLETLNFNSSTYKMGLSEYYVLENVGAPKEFFIETTLY
jgi:hypothetical protein